MAISSLAAMWFLPFVLPICVYICYTDMSQMRIPNHAVAALFFVFVIVGFFVLPFDAYLWRFSHLIIVLIAGMALNAAGALGAGDAKFTAAAAPFIHIGDLRFLMALFAATVVAAYVTHRLGKHSFLRKLAPNWVSWSSGTRFPMGMALGGTLALYLWIGMQYGH